MKNTVLTKGNCQKSTSNKRLFQGYEAVIGIEVHIQLDTKSKLFCSCPNIFGEEPNVNTCSVCLGLPGSLPVLNSSVVDNAISMAIAIGGKINRESVFSRKQYFYPDLPKGYQISQYDRPYCEGGNVSIGKNRSIEIERIHIEEDAGKSIHGKDHSYVDLNRAGTPLLEMVTKPVIFSPKEAAEYLRTVRSIVRYLGICDGNLEEGSIRCDANISLRSPGEKKLGTRTEIKNLNSYRNVEKALDYEILRHADILDKGEKVIQQTVRFDAAVGKTNATRTKEETADYRYFPEPDLPKLMILDQRIEALRQSLPELPDSAFKRLNENYDLSNEDCRIIAAEKESYLYFDKLVVSAKHAGAKLCANWFITEYLREAKERSWNLANPRISAADLGALLDLIAKETISGKIAKMVFAEMIESGQDPCTIIERKGLVQVSDTSEITAVVTDVLSNFPNQVAEYKAGKLKMLGFFVGQIMKKSGGKFNPGIVNNVLKEKLNDSSE
tara:strand:+ start:1073 stop:2566 length:1494 start_codon:yes stop_codon:yes gene_type:complete